MKLAASYGNREQPAQLDNICYLVSGVTIGHSAKSVGSKIYKKSVHELTIRT